MSLSDLIKKHTISGKRGDRDLIPKVDKRLYEFAREPRWDLDWRGISVWHPSQIAGLKFCARRRVLFEHLPDKYLPDAPKNRPGPELSRVFETGTALHAWYQQCVFGPMGILYGRWLDLQSFYRFKNGEGKAVIHEGFMPEEDRWIIPREVPRWKYLEPAVYIKDLNVGGHTDGLIIHDWDSPREILEIKTANSFSYQSVEKSKEPYDYHHRQANLYAHGKLGYVSVFKDGDYHPHGWWFDEEPPDDLEWKFVPFDEPADQADAYRMFYVDKNRQEEMEFLCEKSEEYMRQVRIRIGRVKRSPKIGKLPKRISSCGNPSRKAVKECPCGDACFNAFALDAIREKFNE